jgi:shikimate kinase
MVDPDVHIVLLGPMGAGKTTVGRALADALGRRFLDSDDVIEGSRGRTGAQIAADLGTARLHEIELSTLAEMLGSVPGAVIAAAASVVDGTAGRELLARHFAIWLDADDDVLGDRRERSAHRRRIDADEARRLRELRRPHFAACAVARIDTSLDVAVSVARAMELVEGAGGPVLD